MLLINQLDHDVLRMDTSELISRTRLLDNEIKIMRSEVMRINHEHSAQKEKIKENTEKIKVIKNNLVKDGSVTMVHHHLGEQDTSILGIKRN